MSDNKEIEKQLKGFRFASMTVRLFKVKRHPKSLYTGIEAIYLGTIKNHEASFVLDE